MHRNLAGRTAADIRALAYPVVCGLLLGVLYGVYKHPVALAGAITGGVAGASIGGVLVALERLFFTRRRARPLLRRPMWQFVVFRLAAYLLVTLAGIRLSHLLGDVFLPPDHPHGIRLSTVDVLAAFSLALAFVWLNDLARFMGGRVLLDLLLGRQLQPRHEERVFLLADVVDSSVAAQELGDLRFHAWLNDVFFDLAEAVVPYGGRIYRYIGDQAIITWPLTQPDAGRRAVACAFAITDELTARANRYHRSYGITPEFHYVLHGGTVVAGEMGHLRREVVYLGETLNEASRLERYAKAHGQRMTISDALLSRVVLPPEAEVGQALMVDGDPDGVVRAHVIHRRTRSGGSVASTGAGLRSVAVDVHARRNGVGIGKCHVYPKS